MTTADSDNLRCASTRDALDVIARGRMSDAAGGKSRDAAWARLVKAACEVTQYNASDGYGFDVPREVLEEEYRAARHALRDLGADVDALLSEP